ncbi:MAG: phosphatase PAP2 family protein [Ginsengibacter sp.]
MSLPDYDLRIVELIQQSRIKSLDHFFMGFTDIAPFIAGAIAAFYLLYGFIKKTPYWKYRKWEITVAYLVNAIIITILKYSVDRVRPFVIDSKIEKLTWGGSPSFPSGHTGDAMIIAFMVSMVFNKQKWWVMLVWIWAILVGYSRMVLGVHFFTDVMGSVLISGIVAFIVHSFFKKIKVVENTELVNRT